MDEMLKNSLKDLRDNKITNPEETKDLFLDLASYGIELVKERNMSALSDLIYNIHISCDVLEEDSYHAGMRDAILGISNGWYHHLNNEYKASHLNPNERKVLFFLEDVESRPHTDVISLLDRDIDAYRLVTYRLIRFGFISKFGSHLYGHFKLTSIGKEMLAFLKEKV